MLNFLIAPDYLPPHFGAWYLVNSFVQKRTKLHIRMNMPSSHTEMVHLLNNRRMDLIYANPFDASQLIQKRGYVPLLKPVDKYDEMVVVCRDDAPYFTLHDVPEGSRIALADNRDVYYIGMRLLEGYELNESNTERVIQSSQASVLSAVYHQKAELGFLLADVYHNLSELGESQIRPLMRSRIRDINHIVLLHPDCLSHADKISETFIDMVNHEPQQELLSELGMPKGFAKLDDQEEVDFMIDLMNTLLD